MENPMEFGKCAKAIVDNKPGDVVLAEVMRDCEIIELDYQLLEWKRFTEVPLNPVFY